MTRNIRDLIDEERAVSPVIGVILMVAITVILAAVIGTFVLDLGQSAGQTAPQASLSVDVNAATNSFIIEHTGGDAINQQNTRLIITNESSDTSVTYDAASSSATMSVGGSTNATTDNDTAIGTSGTALISGDLSGLTPGGNTIEVVTGDQYTVTLIDTQSQRQIFETTVTA